MKSALGRFHAKAAPVGAVFVLAASVTALALTACGGGGAEKSPAERGRTLYTLRCASCHNPSDPTKDGGLGPAIAGSSRELLDARLNHGGYPEGYVPKRETRLMRRLPATPEELDALHAYLSGL